MRIFRLRLVAALAMLFVCGSYAERALCQCAEEATTVVDTHPGQGSHEEGNNCQCVCHQAISNDTAGGLRLEGLAVPVFAQILDPSGFPPDPIPRGIDHPPQLA